MGFALSRPDLKDREMIVAALLAAVFLAAGIAKLVGVPVVVSVFHDFGLPHWTLLLIGVAEVSLALMLLVRSTRAWAALGLSLLMIAASFAHVMTHVMLPLLFANAVLCFAAGWLVLQHRPQFLKVSTR